MLDKGVKDAFSPPFKGKPRGHEYISEMHFPSTSKQVLCESTEMTYF